MVEPYKPIYTVKEVSEVLQVALKDAYKLLNDGELPYIILGSRRVRGSDLEKFIAKRPIGTDLAQSKAHRTGKPASPAEEGEVG